MRRRKYNNVATMLDGYRFDSKMEATRYSELKLLNRAGKIGEIEVHPKFPLVVNGTKVCTYEADFRYFDKERGHVTEDVKGARTALFALKKKLMKAVHDIDVQEIKVRRETFPGVDIDKIHRKERS